MIIEANSLEQVAGGISDWVLLNGIFVLNLVKKGERDCRIAILVFLDLFF